MRSVFFGTPDFAVPSLRALVGEGFDVAAVVTQPDRPQGRSRSTRIPSPVKQVATDEGIDVLQPEQPNDPQFLEELSALRPDIGIVVAYGHILKPHILAVPTRGMVNVHASLLPKLRGAAPIVHAILERLDTTGVSIMEMDAGMDTGPILHQVSTPIATDETGGELTVRLAELGALALIEALALLTTNSALRVQQDHHHASYAPKISREMARIRWEEPAERIGRQVRAFDPDPGAWTSLGRRDIKLFGPRLADDWVTDDAPGQIIETDPALVVTAGDGALQFLDVQPAGKARMSAVEWLRGRGATKAQRFG
ncbi:MAG TPA: methionyl-tRNA formyltransferase [Gemmatimonadales bacterium]